MSRLGRLYVCATPIGNLEDITLRALRILREVSIIAAEDTRHTRKLLSHYDISTPLMSMHEHNEAARAAELLARLNDGQSVAIVSDAGMPTISDPGGYLIQAAIDAGVEVIVVPGPTAFVTALVGSGLPTDKFVFEGFLPRHARARRERLKSLAADTRTMVFYEAPHRLRRTLRDMMASLGDRPACVARELTKVFEQWQRGPLSELVTYWDAQTPRGEFVIVVAGAPHAPAQLTRTDASTIGSNVDTAPGPAPLSTTGLTAARNTDFTAGLESYPTGTSSATSTDTKAVFEPSVGELLSDEHIVLRVQQRMLAGEDKKAAVRSVADELGLPRRTVYRAATAIDALSQRHDGNGDG